MSSNFSGKNFEIRGVDEVIKALDEQFSERRSSSIQNKTVNEATEIFKEGLAEAISVYSDTGATVGETTRSRASKKADGTRTSRVGWSGPKKRYKLIHLNEFGYVRWGKRYNPRGTGVIRAYIDKSQKIYIENIRTGLLELLERTGSK